ncbi:hypothetical protein [Paraburkholderia sp. RL17-337-BIB-A]|uniref:hypothetical protein n=1 Tax=Paraburkholderia sp. RL17-337-BIB-A TaxID=3031636 RepID=UPI0038B9B2B3
MFIGGSFIKGGYEARHAPDKDTQEAQAAASAAESQHEQEYKRTVRRVLNGVRSLKNGMRDPDSFVLEDAIVTDATGAMCFNYRSRNGFGGMNRGAAFVIANTTVLVTSEHLGFDSGWRKYCQNKQGRDYVSDLKINGFIPDTTKN